MARPRKHRRLLRKPLSAIFKPVGVPLESLERVRLFHEELEALRLADLQGQHQAEAAQQMGISRSTFQRVVAEARRKVTLALVAGAALHVEGGTFRVANIGWQCADCGHRWKFVHGSGQGQPDVCPNCGGHSITEQTK